MTLTARKPSSEIFTEDFKETPYWWDALPDVRSAAVPPLPASVDVAVVGGGLTGVSAAHKLACAERHTVVVDAGEPGFCASSSNHGTLGRNLKHPFKTLMERVGFGEAIGYYRELHEAYSAAVARIRDEGFTCKFRRAGRFIGALSPTHYERLARKYELPAKHLGEAVEIVPAESQTEIGSARYHGGVILHDNAVLQLALYYQAMRRCAERAGASIIRHLAVTQIHRQGAGFRPDTARGAVAARNVLVATNGYTSGLTPWHRDRLLPINAYTVMTEPLPEDEARTLLPGRRTYHDNRRRLNPFMLAPDGSNRLLFGSRTGLLPPWSLRSLAATIYADMLFFFPHLDGVRLTHARHGRCAATWDLFPHTGLQDGVHFALGYCFSGNAMAPHLGREAALRILSASEAKALLDRERFPKAPRPARNRWFMPAVMAYHSWVDRPTAPLPSTVEGQRPARVFWKRPTHANL